MFFLFWIIFFALGFVIGLISVLIGIITLYYYHIRRDTKEKVNPVSSPKFNKTVPLGWLNTLMWMIFPSFLNSDLLKREMRKIFQSIPRDVRAIKSLTLKDVQFKNDIPPTIEGMSLLTAKDRDHIEFRVHYNPGITIIASAELLLPYIRDVNVTLNFSLHSVHGNVRFFVPRNEGRAEIQMIDNTKIDCDVKAVLGAFTVHTEEMQAIWSSVLDSVHSYLRRMVIRVPLEECLYGKPKEEKKKEKKGDPLVKVRVFRDYHEYVF